MNFSLIDELALTIKLAVSVIICPFFNLGQIVYEIEGGVGKLKI